MYNTRPGLLIGFHGCDRSRQQNLLADPKTMPKSEKPYDWLGHGMYFWENNYDRALQWAKEKKARDGEINEPAVIGAVIDLGYCCDLQDDRFIKMVSQSYEKMAEDHLKIGRPLPVNRKAKSEGHNDKLMRFLDCATIEYMHHSFRNDAAKQLAEIKYTSIKLFDSVRGAFPEGGEAYPGSGFSAKGHIQICVRNPNCIKGFFMKREEVDFFQNEISRTLNISKS